jgi:hypothetical protein
MSERVCLSPYLLFSPFSSFCFFSILFFSYLSLRISNRVLSSLSLSLSLSAPDHPLPPTPGKTISSPLIEKRQSDYIESKNLLLAGEREDRERRERRKERGR